MSKYTISEIKQINKDNGFYFFSPDTMRFFNSRIESGVLMDKYIIISNQYPECKRHYRIIEFFEESGDVKYFTDEQFRTIEAAKDFLYDDEEDEDEF